MRHSPNRVGLPSPPWSASIATYSSTSRSGETASAFTVASPAAAARMRRPRFRLFGKERRMSRLLLPVLALLGLSFTLSATPPKANPFRGEEAPVPLAEPEGDLEFKKGNFRESATWYAAIA